MQNLHKSAPQLVFLRYLDMYLGNIISMKKMF